MVFSYITQICEDYDEHVENCTGREPLTCSICQQEFNYECALKVRDVPCWSKLIILGPGLFLTHVQYNSFVPVEAGWNIFPCLLCLVASEKSLFCTLRARMDDTDSISLFFGLNWQPNPSSSRTWSQLVGYGFVADVKIPMDYHWPKMRHKARSDVSPLTEKLCQKCYWSAVSSLWFWSAVFFTTVAYQCGLSQECLYLICER